MFEQVDKIEEIGIKYAHAKAESWYMQELRKTMLAQIKKEFINEPEWKADVKARSDKRYKLHLQGTKQAIHAELCYKAQCEKLKAEFEADRSKMSLEKAKMNLT